MTSHTAFVFSTACAHADLGFRAEVTGLIAARCPGLQGNLACPLERDGRRLPSPHGTMTARCLCWTATVPVPGFTIDPHILPTTQLFPIAVKEARFDVTELSLSSHILQVARGDNAYLAIPAFISRAFRHNGFYRRAGSGIATLADLAGACQWACRNTR
jgi:hypothetical protein